MTSVLEARRALDALPGITWRPFERDDLPAILDLYTAAETFDKNPERTSLTGLQEFWDSPRSVPEEDTLAGFDAQGRVIATCWSGCNRAVTERRGVFLGGAVHPEHRGRGIGRAVLAWELAHARDWDRATREPGFGPLTLRLYAPTAQADVRDLAERQGLAVERFFFEMERPLSEAIPETAVDGIAFVRWDAARSAEVHAVINSAFLDHWGFVPTTAQMWQEQVASANFRPDWSVLAVDTATDAVVGVAMNCAYQQDWSPTHREGYTDQVGVLRSHRKRGIAAGLLHTSMRRFAADGMDVAALGVDSANPSGALGLYERLGYRPTAETCVHQREES